MSNDKLLIEETVRFVKEQLLLEPSGHDWYHIERVWVNARKIYDHQAEGDRLVIELSALLHDLADSKLTDETEGLTRIQEFLEGEGLSAPKIDRVLSVIQSISFSKHLPQDSLTIEAKIVQDADRLDAIGAVGIARAFTYGGHSGQVIWDPDSAVSTDSTKSSYRNERPTTINHFYEKLLKLGDQMNTEAGKEMAADRHQFMLDFLNQFYSEVEAGQSSNEPDIKA